MRKIWHIFRNLLIDFKDSLRYLVATRFRVFMLIFFLVIVLLFIGGKRDTTDLESDEEQEETLGQILAFSIGVPLSGLFASIVVAYALKDSTYIKQKSHPKYWFHWFIGLILLSTVATIVIMTVGVFWFMLETSVLSAAFIPVIMWIHRKIRGKHSKRVFSNLLSLNLIFFLITLWIYFSRLDISNTLKTDTTLFELMVWGTILVMITSWCFYYYWQRKSTEASKRKLEILPWMFSVAMIIIYFEVFKGLMMTSEISWIEHRDFQLDLITSITVFILAIYNVTKGIVAYVDIEVMRFSITRFKFLPEQNPFILVLAIYALYISKYFYTAAVGGGVDIAFLYSAIIFTFIALFFLNYRIGIILSETENR